MRSYLRLSESRTILAASALWLSAWLTLQLWPATWWILPRVVIVENAAAGAPIRMTVLRDIRRDFEGAWSVQVMRSVDRGWSQECPGSGEATYRTTAVLPGDLDLGWWTGGACQTLPPGTYRVVTTWTVKSHWFWPEKRVTVDSNVFGVGG